MKAIKIDNSHLKQIAEIHKQSYYDDHFSSKLNNKMLMELYSYQIKLNKYSFCVLDEKNCVAGFVVGGYHSHEALEKFKSKKYWKLFYSLLQNPSFFIEKIIQLVKKNFCKTQVNSSEKLRLFSIAIRKDMQGRGVGKLLLKRFENELSLDGINSYGLSVKKSNIQATHFYEKYGFIKELEDLNGIYYRKEIVNE